MKSRVELAKTYRTTPKTIDRCNRIAKIDQVPVPWDNPAELADWYQAHYRSDFSLPPPLKSRALPNWIRDALQAAPPPPPTAPSPALPYSSPPPENPGDPEQEHDPIATAQIMLANIRTRYETAQQDPALTHSVPGLERAYYFALASYQQAVDRARKNGDTEARMLALINERIDSIHRKLPRYLTEEMIALRREARLASDSRDTFSDFCRQFFAAVGERLASVSFQIA